MLDESHTRTLDRVRIPPELHATIWKLFSELKQDTIQQACLHASSRSTEEGCCEVQTEDVAAVIESCLIEAARRANEAFASQELSNARRAS